MGVKPNIRHDQWPKQGDQLGRTVDICFNYDGAHTLRGRVVRDDREEPGETMFELEDGRIVRAVECMWSPS